MQNELNEFYCKLESGTEVRFYQTRRAIGVCAPEFMLEVRGPGQAGQHEFVGKVKVEVSAYGHLEQFRRFLTLTAEYAKPLELQSSEGFSWKLPGASFYLPERTSYEVVMGGGGSKKCQLMIPSYAFRSVRLEMLQTKPSSGDADI